MKKLLKRLVLIIVVLLVLLLALGAFNAQKLKKLAEQGGFENVAEYQQAKKLNITSKSEFDTYMQRQYELAKEAGFETVVEYNQALSVNMPTKELYDAYLLQRAEEKAKQAAEEKAKQAAEEKAKQAAEEKAKQAAENNLASIIAQGHMQIDNVKQAIKDYLGPCSGSACKINIDFLNAYLKKHEDYSAGKISARIGGNKNYIEAYLRNGMQIEIHSYEGLQKVTDVVPVERSDLVAIYSEALKLYGPEVFEDWYRAPKSGIKQFRSKVESFIKAKVSEHMIRKQSSAEAEWDNA